MPTPELSIYDDPEGPAAWVQRRVKTELSPAHRRCVTVAAAISRGAVYNIPTNWSRALFEPWGGVRLTLNCELSTFDFDNLTALVLAAHQHAVRVALSGCGPRDMCLDLYPRTAADPDLPLEIWDRHPTLGDLAAQALDLLASDKDTEEDRGGGESWRMNP